MKIFPIKLIWNFEPEIEANMIFVQFQFSFLRFYSFRFSVIGVDVRFSTSGTVN